MSRKARDPDVRRQELIDIAEELFSERGYEETTVSDIVGAAGLAQGTFYHYFRSKEELLEAIADHLGGELDELIERLVDDEDLSAVEKLLRLFIQLGEYGRGREGLVIFLHEERNALLHLKLERNTYRTWTPLVRSIVVQGVQEGSFDTRYPEEATIALLAVISAISHQGGDLDHASRRRRTVSALFDLTERILGARSGTFNELVEKLG